MKYPLFGLLVLALTFSFTFSAFADEETGGVYRFNGKTYKLQKYVSPRKKTPPPAISFMDVVPDKMDLKAHQTSVKDQADRGSCAHFSATALLESAIKKNSDDPDFEVNISEEHLIWYSKAVLGHFKYSEGSNARQNLRAYADGFLLEKDVPYHPSWFTKGMPCADYDADSGNAPASCYSHKSPAEDVLEKKIEMDGYEVYNVYSYASHIIPLLAKQQSVVVGLPVNQKGWDSKTGHCVFTKELKKECDENPKACGGHSILLTGYDKSRKVFLFKNSWGHEWGKGGYGTLPFDYVDSYASSSSATVTLDSVELPGNHSTLPEATSRNVETKVIPDFELADGSEALFTKVGAKVSYLKGAVLYMSTFLATKKYDGNYDLIKVPEHLKKEYGYYVRGAFYKIFDNTSDLVMDFEDSPATMKIPHKIINPLLIANKEVFARVSIYIFDDVNQWKTLYRSYVPVALDIQ